VPRKPREEEAGAIHHVFARHNEQKRLYRDDADYERYLALLAFVARRCGWRCLAYCLMPNHMHLVIETPQPNLGVGMQRLHGDYGRWFAHRRRRSGHVFQGRYGAVRVGGDEQLWSVAAYIALNPVAARLCDHPEAFRWSSHAAVLGHAPPSPALDAARLLELLGGRVGAAHATTAYGRYVTDRGAEQDR
jgi:putative transposase